MLPLLKIQVHIMMAIIICREILLSLIIQPHLIYGIRVQIMEQVCYLIIPVIVIQIIMRYSGIIIIYI